MQDTKWAVFDMDGVLTTGQEEEFSWRVVHSHFGTDNSENLKAFENGEISYEEFMRKDLEMWSSPHISEIERALSGMKLRPGTEELIDKLRDKGYEVIGILSAGIDIRADKIARELGLEFAKANGFETNEKGYITGVKCRIGLSDKRKELRKMAERYNLPLSSCITVGDGRFDKGMLEAAGKGIAYNPKHKEIMEVADVIVYGDNVAKLGKHF